MFSDLDIMEVKKIMMINILSISISILSIIVGIGVILSYGGGNGLLGSFWVLGTLGAPTTFLYYPILMTGIHKNSFITPYILVYVLYFLQYLLVALFIYKFHKMIDIKIYLSIFFTILISASLMFYLQIGIW